LIDLCESGKKALGDAGCLEVSSSSQESKRVGIDLDEGSILAKDLVIVISNTI